MKKIMSTLLVMSMFALMPVMSPAAAVPVLPVAAEAELSEFNACPRGTYRVRRHTRTKKKVINSLIAGGVGTAIGAGVGGKRGALIGAGSGAGGYLVYRYVRDRRGRCVRSYNRR